jgi:hypothetical protein
MPEVCGYDIKTSRFAQAMGSKWGFRPKAKTLLPASRRPVNISTQR